MRQRNPFLGPTCELVNRLALLHRNKGFKYSRRCRPQAHCQGRRVLGCPKCGGGPAPKLVRYFDPQLAAATATVAAVCAHPGLQAPPVLVFQGAPRALLSLRLL